MSEDLINPDGSIRQIAHMHPSRHTPSTHSPQYPSGHQQTSQSTHHYPPHPHETYSYSHPVPVPVPTTSNTMRMPNTNYANVTMQETFQHQILINSIPRGSHVVPVRVPPPPVQTRSVIQPPPHETPPAVLTPQPAPYLPMENLEAMVSVPAFIQHEQNKKEGEEVEIEQMLVNDNKAEIMHSYTALGQAIYLIRSSLEDQTEKVKSSHKAENELRAKNEVLNDLKKDLEQEVVDIRNEKEEVVKKAAEDVQQAKSEENIWRNKFIELNEELTAIKSQSEEKDNKIRLLIEKAADNETTLTQQEVKVQNFEMSERELKKELEEKKKELECLKKKVTKGHNKIKEQEEKVHNLESLKRKLNKELDDEGRHIEVLEGKLEEKCDQFLKMKKDFNKMTVRNKTLNYKIIHFVKKEKANEKAMQELKANFKLRVEELEALVLEKSTEYTEISDELEKERTDNQNNLEKINEQINCFKDQVNVFKNSDKVTMQNLKTGRDNLKLRVKELEETILQKCKEFSKISQDLKKKENENQVKVNELNNNNKILQDLKDELNSLKREYHDLLERIYKIAQRSVFLDNSKKLHKQTASCSSSGKVTSLEPSMAVDGKTESTFNETVIFQLSLKRKNSPKINNSTAKRQREDANTSTDQNDPQTELISFPENPEILLNTKSSTESGTEIPGKSSTSRKTRSS